ncbi:hypothetical protein XACS582_13190004 [Xanthomonas citri pv. citri]|nr:hypothetical protein XACS584_1780004 [Xanthomonas citri pv. citri]CEF22912.1 hypothetical protein XACJK2_2250001 [Xanthomonas citri pv. citri]CEH58267.1 hypothetical protein XACS582_13190004 [Xanthomonas citri pv. citri]CEH60409.1 hypothetical protein XACJK48_9280001 [Xanthomonas citri pv. citri]CEI00909.1 hypothetical protein XACS581_2820004 [Xanthomonas citri pv. citri]
MISQEEMWGNLSIIPRFLLRMMGLPTI